MAPALASPLDDEQNLERQMGCMAGFLHLFDRHQILAGKRIYSTTKRLPPLPIAGSMSPSETSDASAASFAKDLPPDPCSPSQASQASAETPARPSLPLHFDFKEGLRSSWKLRESPRLSLDSRAVFDAKGKLCPHEIRTTSANAAITTTIAAAARSPSVVARLMGLEALPAGSRAVDGEHSNGAELRRSASESRVQRDVSQFNFLGGGGGIQKSPAAVVLVEPPAFASRYMKPDPPPLKGAPLQRKNFDTRDFFPEPKSTAGSLHGEIERRLRMRGIDEPDKDLETLKQILEALQLKGLLHSKAATAEGRRFVGRRRNLIYDAAGESPIVVMKPAARFPTARLPEPPRLPPRYSPSRRDSSPDSSPTRKPRRNPNASQIRTPRSPEPNPPRRRAAEPPPQQSPQRRISTAGQSPRSSPKKLHHPTFGSPATTSRRRMTSSPSPGGAVIYASADDDDSTISESSVSASSQFGFEGTTKLPSAAVYGSAGRGLLDRCDKLLHSIAAITSPEQVAAVDSQPSPVSVLDPSFLSGGDVDSSSPSAASKRSIDFQDPAADWEEERWSQAVSAFRSTAAAAEGFRLDADRDDLAYVSEIVRLLDRHRGDHHPHDLFLQLEKRHGCGEDSRAHRRLVFDAVAEILERTRQEVSSWEAFARSRRIGDDGCREAPPSLLCRVWVELRRTQEAVVPASGDLEDVTSGALRQDLSAVGDRSWGGGDGGGTTAELSDAVLHMERLIFKDLVAESIHDVLADLACLRSAAYQPLPPPRRRLVF